VSGFRVLHALMNGHQIGSINGVRRADVTQRRVRLKTRCPPGVGRRRSGCRRKGRIRDPRPALRAQKDGSAKQSSELFRQPLQIKSKSEQS
jgi:hypothetical protein